jgi:ABC-type lipoprotein release transport system permease subunit
VAVMLGTVAILAMLKPALRAAGLDPVCALRDE